MHSYSKSPEYWNPHWTRDGCPALGPIPLRRSFGEYPSFESEAERILEFLRYKNNPQENPIDPNDFNIDAMPPGTFLKMKEEQLRYQREAASLIGEARYYLSGGLWQTDLRWAQPQYTESSRYGIVKEIFAHGYWRKGIVTFDASALQAQRSQNKPKLEGKFQSDPIQIGNITHTKIVHEFQAKDKQEFYRLVRVSYLS